MLLFVLSLTARSQLVAIELYRTSVLFTCVNNPLTIVASEVDCSKLFVSTDNGKVEKKSDCLYEIRPFHEGKATIIVKQKSAKGFRTLRQETYAVKPYGLQSLQFGGSFGGNISKVMLRSESRLSAYWSCHDMQIPRVHLLRYTIVVQRKGVEIFRHTISGPGLDPSIDSLTDDFFSNEVIDSDKVIFTDVWGKTCEPEPRIFKPMELTITDAGPGPFKRPVYLPGYDTMEVTDPVTGDTYLRLYRRIAE